MRGPKVNISGFEDSAPGGFVIAQGEGAFPRGLAADLAELVLRAAADTAGEAAVQEFVARAARTGGLSMTFSNGYLRVEGEGEPDLAYAALFEGLFEMLKERMGLREARTLLVDAASHLVTANAEEFIRSGVTALLPPPLKVRLELTAKKRLHEVPEEGEEGEGTPAETRAVRPAPSHEAAPTAPPPPSFFRGEEPVPPPAEEEEEALRRFLEECARCSAIPPRRANRLFDSGFRSVGDVASAPPEQIAELTGWTLQVAGEVRQAARAAADAATAAPAEEQPAPLPARTIEASEEAGPAPPAPAVPLYPREAHYEKPVTEEEKPAAFDPFKPVIIRADAEGKAIREEPATPPAASAPARPPATSGEAPALPKMTPPLPQATAAGHAAPLRRPTAHHRTARKQSLRVILALVVSTALLALVAVSFFRLAEGPFQEYSASEALMYTDTDESAAVGADLEAYGIATGASRTTFIFRLASPPTGPARLGALVDVDGNPATGFRVMAAGADLRIEVSPDGSAATAMSALYEPGPQSDDRNFTSWLTGGELLARARDGGRIVEVQTTRIDPAAGSRAVFYVQSSGGLDSSDAAHAFDRGAVSARFTPEPAGTLPAATPTKIGRLTIEAKGVRGPATVAAQGAGLQITAPAASATFDLEPGAPKDVDIEALTSESTGRPVAASITLSSSDLAVDLQGFEYRGYARAAPASVVVDGAFADWKPVTGLRDPKEAAGFPAQSDLGDYKGAREASGKEVALYLQVSGSVLDGAAVPLKALVQGGGGDGGPVRLPRVSGEDRVGFFVDVDGAGTGMRLGDIGADFLVEARGLSGLASKLLLNAYDPKAPDGWRESPTKPRLGSLGGEAEFAVPYSALGVPDGTRLSAIPFSTAWSGELDFGDSTLVTSVLGGGVSPRFWHGRHMASFAPAPAAVGDVGGLAVFSMASADLDRDGDEDLALGTDDDGNSHLQLFRNDAGTWSGPVDIMSLPGIGSPTQSIAAGDLDHDGDLDLLASNDENDIHALQNPLSAGGDPFAGAWPAQIDIQNGGGPADVRSIALGDLDRDGDLDVVSAADQEIRGYQNPWNAGAGNPWVAGNWGPGAGRQFGTFGLAVTDVVVADFNRDGWPDIATQDGAAAIAVWQDDDPNPFDDGWVFNIAVDVNPDGARGLAAGDLDQDGFPDLASGFWTDNSVRVFANDRTPFSGGWAGTTSFTLGFDPSIVRMEDFDRDGWLDLAAGSEQAGSAGSVAVYENRHEPFSPGGWAQVVYQLLPASSGGVDTSVRGLSAADLDADGDSEVALAIAQGGTGAPDAAIVEDTLVHRNAPVRWGVSPGLSQNGMLALDAADFERDGDLDMVSAGYGDAGGNSVFVYENPSGAATSAYSAWPAPDAVTTFAYSYLADVRAADFDRDGFPDVALHRQRTDGIRGVVLYRNDQTPFNGGWTSAFATGDLPGALNLEESTALAAGDLDRDGRIDLVTATNHLPGDPEPHGYIHVWRNVNGFGGANSWSPVLANTTSHRALDVQLGDLDGDGFLDIVVGAEGDGSDLGHWNFFALRNPRPGPFGSTWARSSAGLVAVGGFNAAVNALSVSDFDRDGDTDVATVDTLGQVVAWENDGTPFAGAWSSTLAYTNGPGGVSMRALDAQDLNLDGWDDLVAGDSISQVSVLGNDYSPFGGTWPLRQHYAANGSLRAVLARDIDNRHGADEDSGDPEILSAGVDIANPLNPVPVRADKNIGAMATEAATDTSPVNIFPGSADDVMRVDVAHNGIAGDRDVEIDTWRFRFYTAAGAPMPLLQMQALFDEFALHLDSDANGVYDPGTDTSQVALTDIAAVTSNVVSLVVNESNAGAAARASAPPAPGKSYFFVVAAAFGGSGSFRVEYDPDGYGSPFNEMNQNISVNGTEPVGSVVESPATLTRIISVSVPEIDLAAAAPVLLALAGAASRLRRRRAG